MEENNPGGKVAAPVASTKPAGEANPAPANAATVATVQKFGGLPGGRPRKDGHAPGSPEAIAADREKERLRKERWRTRVAAQNPPVLPVASPAENGSALPPGPDPVNLSPVAGGGPVAWDPATLKPLFEELVPQAEAELVASLGRKATKANIPGPLLKEIERDARWSNTAKTAVTVSAPQVAAKWLNKSGISAENQAEVVLTTAILSIAVAHLRLSRRLDELIKQRAATPEVKAEPAKKPTP